MGVLDFDSRRPLADYDAMSFRWWPLPFEAKVIGAVAAWLLATVLAAPAAITLASKGKSSYRIVVATTAIASERYAAEELQQYLEKMTGARLPIVTDAEKPKAREILLGDNAHLRHLGLNLDSRKLGADGFTLRTDRSRLIIFGNQPRGTLNGVYTLLEEKLGVHWFTPELEVVPRIDRLTLPGLNETQIPALENREVFWVEAMRDADFAARHRLNGNHYKFTEKHGGRLAVYFPFVHSIDSLIPPELYKEHPEYFPLIKGERVSGYVQRCLSNPEVVKLAKARVRQWIKEHPEANIISVSQNDSYSKRHLYCQCGECKALDEREGSPAASMLRFVNAIAEDLEHDYPHIRVDTLAYGYTRKPPKTIRPRRNVIIRLCSIECCFAHPLAACASEENRRFCDDIIAWQSVAPFLYVWDYTIDFDHFEQPFPNFDALQPNVQFFVQHGVRGLFEEGNYCGGGGAEMAPLRAYVLAKILWNPNTDVQKHIREFLNAYYGLAAPKLHAYLDLLHQQVRSGNPHVHIWESPQSAYLSDDFVNAGERILDEGEQLAENDDVRFRVQVARLPVWYVKIATNRVTGDPKIDLVKRFVAIARQAGVSNISEKTSLSDWAKKLGVE
jgi:hypothetical protein